MNRLSPSDVRTIAFRKPPIGKRGYDERDVDEFLDQVETTLSDMMAEITLLRAQASDTPVPAGTGALDPGQRAVLAELDLIKVRLTRIEDAVRPQPSRMTFRDGGQGSGR